MYTISNKACQGRVRLLQCCLVLLSSLLCTAYRPAYGQRLELTLTDSDGAPVADAVVEIMLPADLRGNYDETGPVVVDQVDKEFVPLVSIVVAGSNVSFPNSDAILHHVYSFSPAHTFDIPLYGSGDEVDYEENFPDTGLVEIGCNIHDWMLAYLYIAESRLAAISNANGVAVIEDVPAGTYPVRLWHSRLGEGQQAVFGEQTFTAGQTTAVSTTVELERERRLRRAPSANRQRYR